MVIIKIPTNIGEVKENGEPAEIKYNQHGSMPLSMGLQIDLVRYSRDGLRLARAAKEIQDIEANGFEPTDQEQSRKLDTMLEEMEDLYKKKLALILRAFGNRFSIDDLMSMDPVEIDTVIAQLQMESRGAARKNVPPGE